MGAYLLKDPALVEKNREATSSSIFPRLQERLKQTAGTLSGGESSRCWPSAALAHGQS